MISYKLSEVAEKLVNLMVALVGTLLGLRFVLKMFSANASNSFVSWVYDTSAEVLSPFRNVFPSQNLDGFVIEFSTIFAMVVYVIFGLLALYVIDFLSPSSNSRKK